MAAVSFRKWKEVPLNDRVDLVKKFVDKIISEKEILKPLISQSIGKSYNNIDEEFRRIENISYKLIESGRLSLKSQVIEQESYKVTITSFS